MKKNKDRYLVAVAIFGILLTLMFIFLGFVLLGEIFGDNKVLPNVINAMTFGLTIIYILVLSFYINSRFTLVSIQNDNEYNLGERSTFNNLYAFQRQVEYRIKINNRFFKKSQHIIASYRLFLRRNTRQD